MPDSTEEVPQVSSNAFGQAVILDVGDDDFLRDDSLWRVREIYEPALASQILPASGRAVDVGAGFGSFAIPFALAWPGWEVVCFEPDAESFKTLVSNIARYDLSKRIRAVPIAVATIAGRPPKILEQAMRSGDPNAMAASASARSFWQNTKMPSFISPSTDQSWAEHAQEVSRETLPPDALTALAPDLVKFTCPGNERALLEALEGTQTRVIVGECWTPPPTKTVFDMKADSSFVYVPLAGTPLRLRKDSPPEGRRHGLDVVVAMYNARDYILDCVRGIVGSEERDIRALVVDDGSTDGCGDLVAKEYEKDPRVKVISKPNGGCASARNYGRLASDATHIGFVDADDVPDADLFPELLELARYSGAAVTQGGFDLLFDDPGDPRRAASIEAADFADMPRTAFGSAEFFTLPWETVVVGQPTIWRRVYRRDFLDAKNVWFPEHIRAFDDQIFQMLSGYYAGTVFARDDVLYHYRQHPGQDIRQGDERMVFSLEMYRLVLRRAVTEGWPNFAPFAVSFFNTLEWTSTGIDPSLKDGFLRGAAELWVYMSKVFGPNALKSVDRTNDLDPVFGRTVTELSKRLGRFADSYAWAYLDAPSMHPDMVRASAAQKASSG